MVYVPAERSGHSVVADYRTTDTALATFLSWKKGCSVIPLPRGRSGRAVFVIVGVTPEKGAELRNEFSKTEYFEFEARRRALIQDIPEDTEKR